VIYLDMAEYVQLPFHFRIELEYDQSWIDCEFMSQRGSNLVARMIAASFDSASDAEVRTGKQAGIDLDAIESWRGRK
jgi:hypothetical protein